MNNTHRASQHKKNRALCVVRCPLRVVLCVRVLFALCSVRCALCVVRCANRHAWKPPKFCHKIPRRVKHFGCTHFCLRRCEVPVKCRWATLPAGFHELPTTFARPAIGCPLPRRIVHLLHCCWPVCRGLRLLVPLSSLHCASFIFLLHYLAFSHTFCLRSGLVDHLPMFFHQRRSTLLSWDLRGVHEELLRPMFLSTESQMLPLLPSHTHADTWRLDFLRLPGDDQRSYKVSGSSKYLSDS